MTASSRAVVLVHGFGGSPATFAPLVEGLRAEGVPVHAVSWNPTTASWPAWVAQVEGAVVQAGRGVVLVGQSAGAALALAVAVGRPDLVERVVLLNPLVLPMDEDTMEFLAGRLERGSSTVPVEPVSIVDPAVSDPDAADAIDLAGLLALHEGLGRLRSRLDVVDTPVRVLRGSDDDVLGPEHVEALLELMPRASAEEIAGGHLAALDVGRRFVLDAVLDSARLGSGGRHPGAGAGAGAGRRRRSRFAAATVVLALVGSSGWFAVRSAQGFLEDRAEAAALRRLGTCEILDPAAGTVACQGIVLATIRLPPSFTVCRRWREQGRDCIVEVHERARPAFLDAIDTIDAQGLGELVTEFSTVNQRMCRDARTGGWRAGCVSRHSYGIAADIRPFGDNVEWDALVAGDPRLTTMVGIWKRAGFRWGGDFGDNPDPQHVEWRPR